MDNRMIANQLVRAYLLQCNFSIGAKEYQDKQNNLKDKLDSTSDCNEKTEQEISRFINSFIKSVKENSLTEKKHDFKNSDDSDAQDNPGDSNESGDPNNFDNFNDSGNSGGGGNTSGDQQESPSFLYMKLSGDEALENFSMQLIDAGTNENSHEVIDISQYLKYKSRDSAGEKFPLIQLADEETVTNPEETDDNNREREYWRKTLETKKSQFDTETRLIVSQYMADTVNDRDNQALFREEIQKFERKNEKQTEANSSDRSVKMKKNRETATLQAFISLGIGNFPVKNQCLKIPSEIKGENILLPNQFPEETFLENPGNIAWQFPNVNVLDTSLTESTMEISSRLRITG
jgi:hypothetical protein